MGTIFELTSALNTTLSVAASPRTIFPSVPAANVTTPTKNELPVTDNPPPTFTSLTVILGEPVKPSASAAVPVVS